MISTLKIVHGSITDLDVDCIVNAANDKLQHGGGVCGAIFKAAGAKELQDACNMHGGCPTGMAVITPGFKLKAQYIIHAVGPIWHGGRQNEEKLLYSCYRESMKLAMEYECHSIAFPLISSGIYGYPKEDAWKVAIRAITDFQKQHEDYVLNALIAVIDTESLKMGNGIIQESGSDEFVFFWHEYEQYGVFSQWFDYPITIEGICYRNCEQYMMAKKALFAGDLEKYVLIMHESDPQKIKKLGRDVRDLDKKGWDHCKKEIVYNANRAKFTQHEKARHYLMSTGRKTIAEASPMDREWGIGLEANHPAAKDPHRWPGKNMLGEVLMRIREEFREKGF